MGLTLEEKRARDAKYKRDARARRRAALNEAAGSTSDASDVGSHEASVRASIAAMKQIEPSDQALVDAAITTAKQIDLLVATRDVGMASRIFTGMTTLKGMLHELGGTPTVRMQFEFRSRKNTMTTGAVSDDADEPPATESSNVTSIRRPEKRGRRKG